MHTRVEDERKNIIYYDTPPDPIGIPTLIRIAIDDGQLKVLVIVTGRKQRCTIQHCGLRGTGSGARARALDALFYVHSSSSIFFTAHTYCKLHLV